jgi:hypothetical protein
MVHRCRPRPLQMLAEVEHFVTDWEFREYAYQL